MVDTNGFNKIQAAAEKAKTFFDRGLWKVVHLWVGWVQYIINTEISNIDVYNILHKVTPLFLKNGTLITSSFQGMKFLI